MLESDLHLLRDNTRHELRTLLSKIGSGPGSPNQLFNVAHAHRVLGLCALLGSVDVERFRAHLTRSGLARVHFLRAVREGLETDDIFLCTSKSIAFAAAVAAGDQPTAREIAELSPHEHFQELEYEDDFLFYHFLHRSVAGDDRSALTSIVERWAEVLDGAASGYHAACVGLAEGSPESFAEGFEALIDERHEELAEYRESITFDRVLFSAEGKVFVEGLAVLRIADQMDIPTADAYPLIPSVGRLPQSATPIQTDWRQID